MIPTDDLGYRSLQELVRNRLREAIVRGSFGPGEPLNIASLAQKYGVSALPVREALRALEAEGLVSFSRNRGASVRVLTPHELRETFLIRIPLERLATLEGVPKLTEPQLVQLETLVAEMDPGDADRRAWIDQNQEFHLSIYRAADLPRLQQMITTLWAVARPYLSLFVAGAEGLHGAHSEHEAILRACRTGDAERAADIVTEHLSSTRDRVLSLIEAQQRSSQPDGDYQIESAMTRSTPPPRP